MASFVVTATGFFLPVQLICQGKSKIHLLKCTFTSDFHLMFTPNHWSNLKKCKDIFNVIIFPCLSAKKKELGYSEEQCSLIIMDTFKGQDNDEMKQWKTKNNCELVIVPHNLTNKFQPLHVSINQRVKNWFQSSSKHSMLIESINNYQMGTCLVM